MAEFVSQYGLMIAGLVAAGLFAGLIAGLFGIGGGIIIVPVLYYLFTELGYGAHAIHMAIATSLATIIATSIRSVMAHHRRGAVDWAVVRAWTPWIVLGTLIGSQLAARIPGRELTILFGCVMLLLSAQIGLGRPNWRLAEDLPRGPAKWALGGLMGALSAMLGIGGGTLGVSLMTLCGRSIHQSVATAAGFGAAIGLPGAIGYVVAGWQETGLPPGSLGYVNLIAFAILSVFTVSMAPVGAHLAHALPARSLKRLFAVGLAIIAMKMVYDQFT